MPIESDLHLKTAQAVPAIALAFDGFAVEHVEIEDTTPLEYVRQGDSWYLALHDFRLDAGEISINQGEFTDRTRRDLRDTMTLLPPGTRAEGWSKPSARRNWFTALYFAPELLSPELAELFDRSRLGPILYGRDAALSQTLRKIAGLVRGGHGARMPLEQLAILAAYEAQGLAQPKPLTAPPTQLSPRQLARVIDYIAANLVRDISLDDLARAAELSRFHFSRAFAASTGMSPYAYLTARRSECASRLLATGKLTREEVARQSGLGTVTRLRRAIAKSGGTPATVG